MQWLPARCLPYGWRCIYGRAALSSSHPLLPLLCSHTLSLHLCLYCDPQQQAHLDHLSRFYVWMLVFLFLTYFTLYHKLWVPPHPCKWPNSIPSYGRVMFHCMHVPHLYPFISQWTFRLLLCPGCCKQCCNEHTNSFWHWLFHIRIIHIIFISALSFHYWSIINRVYGKKIMLKNKCNLRKWRKEVLLFKYTQISILVPIFQINSSNFCLPPTVTNYWYRK